MPTNALITVSGRGNFRNPCIPYTTFIFRQPRMFVEYYSEKYEKRLTERTDLEAPWRDETSWHKMNLGWLLQKYWGLEALSARVFGSSGNCRCYSGWCRWQISQRQRSGGHRWVRRSFLVKPEKRSILPTQTEGSKKSHEVIGLRCGSSDAFLIF